MPAALRTPQQEAWTGWVSVSWPTHVLGAVSSLGEKLGWRQGEEIRQAQAGQKGIMEIFKFCLLS